MATAADHKIIIEKGADFKIDLRVTTDGINPFLLTDYTGTMYLMYHKTNGTLEDYSDDQLMYVYVDSGVYTESDTRTPIISNVAPTDAGNGEITIELDGTVTDKLPSDPDGSSNILDRNKFATEYNYFYYIEVVNPGGDGADDDIVRVLRGKAAVRV